MFKTQPIARNELPKLITFDNEHIQNVMLEYGVPINQLAPTLTEAELETAYRRNDELAWIYINDHDEIAGYCWFEPKADSLYLAGIAIRREFFGRGICQHILNYAEQVAQERGLLKCSLAVIPLNGRAIKAYLKHGYQIVRCVPAFFGIEHPDTLRFVMEKHFILSQVKRRIISKRTIVCTDTQQLQKAIDSGYVGIGIVQPQNNNNFENKIIFAKYR